MGRYKQGRYRHRRGQRRGQGRCDPARQRRRQGGVDGRDDVEGQESRAQINSKTPGSALFIKHDIASKMIGRWSFAKTEETFGGLDILVTMPRS